MLVPFLRVQATLSSLINVLCIKFCVHCSNLQNMQFSSRHCATCVTPSSMWVVGLQDCSLILHVTMSENIQIQIPMSVLTLSAFSNRLRAWHLINVCRYFNSKITFLLINTPCSLHSTWLLEGNHNFFRLMSRLRAEIFFCMHRYKSDALLPPMPLKSTCIASTSPCFNATFAISTCVGVAKHALFLHVDILHFCLSFMDILLTSSSKPKLTFMTFFYNIIDFVCVW